MVMARGRQAGKTYDLRGWVKQGVETDSYPGWSRVILTHSLEEAQRLRTAYDLDYRQVFSVEEWRSARLGRRPVEVALDNADLVLAQMLGQMPRIISVTGWQEPERGVHRG
jgi:hypothetical protein